MQEPQARYIFWLVIESVPFTGFFFLSFFSGGGVVVCLFLKLIISQHLASLFYFMKNIPEQIWPLFKCSFDILESDFISPKKLNVIWDLLGKMIALEGNEWCI